MTDNRSPNKPTFEFMTTCRNRDITLTPTSGGPVSETIATSRSADLARKRRYRERQAVGAIVVAVEVDQEAIDALVDLGEIAPVQREDRHAIAEAIGDLVQRIVTERCSSDSKREQ